MGSLFCPSLIVFFSLWLTLISPSHSIDCSSLKLPGGIRHYSNCTELPTLNCTELPTLNCTLHFTYNATNSSLFIAFSAAPSNADGWIAWAVNPTDTGMAGSQALLAFKNKGSIVLSFDVWDLEAEATNDGKMVVYGSLKVEGSVEKLNQVWQVGPGVSDGHPMKHEFGKANLGSWGELKLVEKVSSGSSSPAPSPVPHNDSGDGSRAKIYAGFWILALVSWLVSVL
ncbi:hypothetical protein E1A91_A07G162400v1 [Gossypium mustelinum]|uniref:AIR12 DOMON domain-containing protein n=1 Tax=Gossypium mustelinum TaxID=34275 RepID=A0A5D2YKX7_GOSMU|nr:hypothetical protein E1A91_A07G162400v1 [Gossypium mustelinum]